MNETQLGIVGTLALMASVLFITTLLRGMQSKAASSGQYTFAGVGGTLMNACEIMVTISVVGAASTLPSPYYALFASFGAGAGWIAGMLLHERMVRRRRAKLKAVKKSKRQRQIERIARETAQGLMEERGL